MSSESDSEDGDEYDSSDEQQEPVATAIPLHDSARQTAPTRCEYKACRPKLKSINVKSFKSDLACRRELRKRGNFEIKRAKLRRAKFRKKYPNTDAYDPLTSSEDDTDMDREIDETNRTFPDFKELARKSSLGRNSVFKDMAILSIDEAVGWAHHQSTNGGDPSKQRRLPAPNPLLDAATTSSSPLPISMLNHIGERLARCKSKPKPKAKAKNEGAIFWKDTMEFSAKVGVGMLVEEMVTASLLPLARLHAVRCRSLRPAEAFDEWTLPPDEAIHKLRNHPDVLEAAKAHHQVLFKQLELMQDDDDDGTAST